MQRSTLIAAIIVFGTALAIVSAIALIGAAPAQAQCGSQASSCKNCHETQGQDPVNGDGTGWHESHAFGDFCYICHAGNNQATDAETAHAGMVDPMSDVQAACAQCHPNDLQARADVYTAALGIAAVQIGSAGPAAPTPTEASTVSEATALVQSAPTAPPAPATVSDAEMVDYIDRYNQEVLNQQPTNWGNLVLIVLLVALVGAGFFFINRREGWVSVSFREKQPATREYPKDVLEVAEQVEKLNVNARQSLMHLLSKGGAADLLAALDRFSTDDASGEKKS